MCTEFKPILPKSIRNIDIQFLPILKSNYFNWPPGGTLKMLRTFEHEMPKIMTVGVKLHVSFLNIVRRVANAKVVLCRRPPLQMCRHHHHRRGGHQTMRCRHHRLRYERRSKHPSLHRHSHAAKKNTLNQDRVMRDLVRHVICSADEFGPETLKGTDLLKRLVRLALRSAPSHSILVRLSLARHRSTCSHLHARSARH